jgi:hypothetical protein
MSTQSVIPAKAGIQYAVRLVALFDVRDDWVPACAGTTGEDITPAPYPLP